MLSRVVRPWEAGAVATDDTSKATAVTEYNFPEKHYNWPHAYQQHSHSRVTPPALNTGCHPTTITISLSHPILLPLQLTHLASPLSLIPYNYSFQFFSDLYNNRSQPNYNTIASITIAATKTINNNIRQYWHGLMAAAIAAKNVRGGELRSRKNNGIK